MAKRKGGRPTKMTSATLRKLEKVYAYGGNDVEACLYAGIGKSTLYDYQHTHPEFSERKSQLQTNPVLATLQTISKAIEDGDVEVAKWLLERRCRDEYAPPTRSRTHINLNIKRWRELIS